MLLIGKNKLPVFTCNYWALDTNKWLLMLKITGNKITIQKIFFLLKKNAAAALTPQKNINNGITIIEEFQKFNNIKKELTWLNLIPWLRTF